MKHTFILFIGARSWLRYGRKPHYSELNRFGKLIVVEEPLKIFSREFLTEPWKAISDYLKFSKGIRTDHKYDIKVLRPILLFSSKLKNISLLLKKIDLLLLSLFIKKLKNSDNFNYYLLTNRFQEWVVDKKNNSYFILDIDDEWSMMAHDDSVRKEIERDMRRLIDKVDFATAVTKKLQNKYDINNKVFFLPNAVDTNHYVPRFDEKTIRTEEKSIKELNLDLKFLESEKNDPNLYLTNLDKMKEFKKPIVGMISGLSSTWSDFAFMSKVEELLSSKFTLVSSGNIYSVTNESFIEEYNYYLEKQRMNYLGFVDYSVLPDFLELVDVGIIVYRMNEFNTHSAPNKIWAYLAMGLPVVSTDFLNDYDKEIYEGKVKFAKTPEEFVEFIIEEHHSDNIEKKKKRRELAVRYSTINRAEKLYSLIIKK